MRFAGFITHTVISNKQLSNQGERRSGLGHTNAWSIVHTINNKQSKQIGERKSESGHTSRAVQMSKLA